MSSESLRQACLAFLIFYHDRQTGYTTREIADYLDISVYQTRLLLLKLQDEGLVREVPGRKPGRGAALRWDRT